MKTEDSKAFAMKKNKRMYNPNKFKCTILKNENCLFMFVHFEKKIPSSSILQLCSVSVSWFYDVFHALLQFELGLLGLHGFGGHLGALRQQRCLLSWSLRLDILEQEVADEKLQALPQHSELGNSWNPGGWKTRKDVDFLGRSRRLWRNTQIVYQNVIFNAEEHRCQTLVHCVFKFDTTTLESIFDSEMLHLLMLKII